MCRCLGARLLFLASLSGAATTAGPVLAGSISLTTQLTATVKEQAVTVALDIANSGDEAAVSVTPQVDLAGQQARGVAYPSLRPGERMQVSLELPGTRPPGQWPLVVRIDYADAKGYPFQALQVALVSRPAAPALVAVVDVQAERIAGSGTVRARVKSLAERPQKIEVRFVVPRELAANPAARTASLPAWGEETLRTEVVNRAALAGSRYAVFITTEYDDEQGVHHTALGDAMLEVGPATHSRPRYAWAAAAALIVVWLVLMAWRRLGRGRAVKGHGPRSTADPGGTPPPGP